MNFEYSDTVKKHLARIDQFLTDHYYPIEKEIYDSIENNSNRWSIPVQIEQLKELAKSEGLWNFFLPDSEYGHGLTN
ncbi:MAG: acyl-CoA dehydrogenase, partial [Gammaproteobacteria bacterium]|nr:acyl-CoA dehydrogenase [Gammaproteobacteria bacterium]